MLLDTTRNPTRLKCFRANPGSWSPFFFRFLSLQRLPRFSQRIHTWGTQHKHESRLNEIKLHFYNIDHCLLHNSVSNLVHVDVTFSVYESCVGKATQQTEITYGKIQEGQGCMFAITFVLHRNWRLNTKHLNTVRFGKQRAEKPNSRDHSEFR